MRLGSSLMIKAMTTADAMAHLRRIAEALAGGKTAAATDTTWFLDALRRYQAGGPSGLSFDRALGLVPEGGQESWWTVEARRKRDDLIRALREQHFPDIGVTRAAHRIAKLAADYQAAIWRSGGARRPDSDPRKRLVASALETGLPFPKARHVENILRTGRRTGRNA